MTAWRSFLFLDFALKEKTELSVQSEALGQDSVADAGNLDEPTLQVLPLRIVPLSLKLYI